MKRYLKAAIALGCVGAGGLMASAAQADCHTAPFRFALAKNDAQPVATTTDKDGCIHRFPNSPGAIFTKADVVGKPQHGSLIVPDVSPLGFWFRYAPSAGYTGADTYAVKLCGKTVGGEGCSTLNYTATVK